MNVLDLFSGVGAFSLGLERSGMHTVAFCEIERYQRAVLAKHWPDVPCYDDVTSLTGERLATDGIAVDVICGGFPCQDISHAGAKAGIEGARSGLWSEYSRLIGELRPNYVIVENVTALRGRGLARVLSDLAALGYDAEWHCIPASALGAPHPRDRIWIIAYAAALRRDEREWPAEKWGRFLRPGQLDRPSPWATPENNHEVRSSFLRIVDGLPGRVDRLGACGNAVTPIIPQIIGEAIMAHHNHL